MSLLTAAPVGRRLPSSTSSPFYRRLTIHLILSFIVGFNLLKTSQADGVHYLFDPTMWNSENWTCMCCVQTCSLNNKGLTRIPWDVFNKDYKKTPFVSLDLEHNKLPWLDKKQISYLNATKELYLGHNPIQTIERDLFIFNKNIRTLGLDFTQISSFPVEVFHSLGELKHLSFSGSQLRTLQAGLFTNPKLETMDASNNNLVEIQPGAFQLPKLLKLDLQRNQLELIAFEVLASLPSLRVLNLTRNQLKRIPQGLFANLPSLETLDLGHQPLSRIERGAFNLPMLRTLVLEGCSLVKIKSEMLANLPKLTHLSLRENRISRISSGTFINVPNLLTLDLSKQSLRHIQPGAFDLPMLETLYLQKNNLVKVRLAVFKLPRLQALYLQENKLRVVQSGNCDLPSLRILNITHNNLTKLPLQTFYNLPSIKTVHLDSNRWDCGPRLCGWLSPAKNADKDNAVCNSPPFMFGVKLTSLCRDEIFQTSENKSCKASFKVIGSASGNSVASCEKVCKSLGKGWLLSVPQTLDEYTCLVNMDNNNPPLWTGILVSKTRFYSRYPHLGKPINFGKPLPWGTDFIYNRRVAFKPDGDTQLRKGVYSVYIQSGVYTAVAKSFGAQSNDQTGQAMKCGCQYTPVKYDQVVCSGFKVLANNFRKPVDDCEQRCKSKGMGWGLAVPTTRHEYVCLAKAALGDQLPVWTGLRVTKTDFYSSTPSGERVPGVNFGRKVPSDVKDTIFDDYTVFSSAGDSENKNGVYSVFLHHGFYVAAVNTYDPAPKDPVQCGCQRHTVGACKVPEKLNNAYRIFNRLFWSTGMVFFKCIHKGHSFSPRTDINHTVQAVKCTSNNVLEPFPTCELYKCHHPAVANSDHTSEMVIDIWAGQAVKCNPGYSFNQTNSQDNVRLLSCGFKGLKSRIPQCSQIGASRTKSTLKIQKNSQGLGQKMSGRKMANDPGVKQARKNANALAKSMPKRTKNPVREPRPQEESVIEVSHNRIENGMNASSLRSADVAESSSTLAAKSFSPRSLTGRLILTMAVITVILTSFLALVILRRRRMRQKTAKKSKQSTLRHSKSYQLLATMRSSPYPMNKDSGDEEGYY